jgi:hypothetical protein
MYRGHWRVSVIGIDHHFHQFFSNIVTDNQTFWEGNPGQI